MATRTPPPHPPTTECKQCAAPDGNHAAFCETGVTALLECIERRHTFTNTAPTGEKPLWECEKCGEPRITPTEYPAGSARGAA